MELISNGEEFFLAIFVYRLFSTFVQLSCILLVLIFRTFCATESTKELGTRAHHPLTPLVRELPQWAISLIRRSLAVSSLSAGSRVLRNALRVAILRKCNCHTAFERPRTMACSQQGFTLCCLRCRCFLKLPCAMVLTRTMVIPIKSRHRQNHS